MEQQRGRLHITCSIDDVNPCKKNIFGCYHPINFCGFEVPDNEALEMIQQVLADPPPDLLQQMLTAIRCRRALILERMGNISMALADYVGIYTSQPESAWGIFARMHIEPRSKP